MEGGSSFIVGIEAGFSKQHSSKMKPQWIVLFNPTEKYRMLEKDALTLLCGCLRWMQITL
jgi:hypothetical protein